MIYYVIELQTSTIGAVIPFAFDNLPDAQAKFYTLLSVAVKSNVPKHGAILFNEDGFVIESKVFVHESVQAETVITDGETF